MIKGEIGSVLKNLSNKSLNIRYFTFILCIPCFIVFAFTACSKESEQVVIYTSVDQVYSEPLLEKFEKETGIEVLAVYDVEASKSTGLANRLIAEKNNPKADVFWSGEFVQTMMLKEEDVLAPYQSDNTEGLMPEAIDPQGYWTAFGGRARVLLINTDLVSKDEYPTSMAELISGEYSYDRVGLAYPLFGTTANHVAALYAYWGQEDTRLFFEELVDRGISVVDGNSVVRDMVADGRLDMGLTDTDDAISALEQGKPVDLVFLDQGPNEMGTFLIPNTTALIAGGPNESNGKLLIDYLLSQESELYLNNSGWFDLSIRKDLIEGFEGIEGLKIMTVSYEEVYKQLKLSANDMREVFLR